MERFIFQDWTSLQDSLPPDDQIVITLTQAGNIYRMYLHGEVWYHADSGATYGALSSVKGWADEHAAVLELFAWGEHVNRLIAKNEKESDITG